MFSVPQVDLRRPVRGIPHSVPGRQTLEAPRVPEPAIWDTSELGELDELLDRQLGLTQDRAKRPWGQLAVHRHDHRQLISPELYVAPSLADLDEADACQGADDRRTAEDRK